MSERVGEMYSRKEMRETESWQQAQKERRERANKTEAIETEKECSIPSV